MLPQLHVCCAPSPPPSAGTERTDSDALGRLPHAGGAAASEYTDSMDVDVEGAAGGSQGGASQQQTTGRGVVVAGSMDTAGEELSTVIDWMLHLKPSAFF